MEHMDKTLKITIAVLAILIIILLGVFVFYHPAKSPTLSSQTSSTDVSSDTTSGGTGTGAMGVMSADGHLMIDSGSLRANIPVESPIIITGTITGGKWFFEGTFPVKILDGNGTVLGTTTADAEGDWTSPGVVAFRATLTFTKPKYKKGTVILSRDNPSGLAQNAQSLSIPVQFP